MNSSVNFNFPTWIDKNYIKNVLRNVDKTAELVDFKLSLPSSKLGMSSERIVANISFLNFENALDSIKVIIKIQPVAEGLKKELVESTSLFKVEMTMFAYVLPKMSEVLRRAGEVSLLHPKVFFQTNEPTPNIVMEYFDPSIYKCAFEKLDTLQKALPIFNMLAKFHAASFFLAEQENMDFTHYKECIYDNPDTVEKLIRDTLRALRLAMRNWEYGIKFIGHIDNLIQNCYMIGKDLYIPNPPGDGYNVICHADYHLGNMLRNKNDRNDLYLIDFQTACWCSPAIDFWYALFQLAEHTRAQHFGDLVNYYHKVFTNVLVKAGFKKPIPSLDHFNIELRKRARVRTLFSTCFEPYTFANMNEATIEDLNDFHIKERLFASEKCKNYLERELEYLVRENLI